MVEHVLQKTLTAEAENSSELDEAILSAMLSSERRKLELSIRKLHHNCGRPPTHVLVRMLRWNGTTENVLAAARVLRCSACAEAKPPENPGESSVVTWLSGNTPVFKTRSAPVDMRR